MWLRTTLSQYSVAAAVAAQLAVTILLPSCTTQSRSEEKSEATVVAQSCDSCNWRIAEIDFVDAIPTDTFRITQPTVIEFFTLAGDQSWFDSLPDNHQTYYRMMDQYGHYTVRYRPLLESRGVKIISKPTRTVYFFEDDKHEYIVDARSYLRNDGVLMFTPGKAPVFWTAAVMKPGCDDSTVVKCYFGK